MDVDETEFYSDIVECLIRYGNLSPNDAKSLLTSSHIYQPKNDDKDLGILEHETPYYWAMHLVYSKEKPDWYQDSKLWPPPKDYLDKWYGSK